MRVYEFSKKSGIANKELLDLLKKGGFSITTHMAVLPDQAVTFLEQSLKKEKGKPVQEPVSAPKKATLEKAPTPKPVIEKSAPETQARKTAAPMEKPQEKTVTHKVEPQKQAPQVVQKPQQVSAPQPVVEKKVIHPTYVPKREEAPVVRRAPEPEKPSIQAPKEIVVMPMIVDELAQKLKKPVSEIILVLLKKGIVSTKNQMLQEKVVIDVVRHFGLEVVFPTKKEAVLEKRTATTSDKHVERMPVVVVMGHVDHGKTTLLDFIRKTRVAAKEKGGITQHLGAYEVDTKHGGIVFLDTPGHEAFSQIRIRGIKVADVAVLVVAADDSVKPQTIEAVKHAKALEVPIIVAVNKIDKVEPQRVDVVKRDLAQYDVVPEEWGGSAVFVPISAKVGTGVSQLLEVLALQSQIMELKADATVPGKGVILESKLEKGRGPVATVICQEGRVITGEFFICGGTQGKITSMVDSFGRRVAEAGPSIPVQISGFEDLANVGDSLSIVSEKEYREFRASKGERRVLMPRKSFETNTINIIIKADGNASKEAILGSLSGLGGKNDKEIYVVHSGAGSITESDIILAANTDSIVFGLHVKAEPNALVAAQKNAVSIHFFDIIYKMLDELKELIEGSKQVVMVKQKLGEAVVRKVFDIKGLGVIAGCYVREGRITRECTVVIWRGREKVGQGKIRSLQRDKKTVKEVHTGFECAFLVDNFTEWQEDDRVECFVEVPKV